MKSTKGRRVLVIEDEAMVAMGLEMALADAGYDVVGPVGTFDDAIEAASRERIDCALLDVNLRGREAYPVAEILATRKVPFAFLTGYGADKMPAAYAARAVLTKPFRAAELLAAVGRLSQ